ncbi:MAG: hypothetical protein QMD10_10905, partial [Desulfitobacteriaceae bacterium]|nr:hypothetical protein [Desulfitobacteriaceae bacterium]
IQYTLDLLVRAGGYAPNATVLWEIASPLPGIEDPYLARELVARFDSQKAVVEKLGPTEDYIRLILSLASTEAIDDLEAACNRLVELWMTVSDIEELQTKAVCAAHLVATLERIQHREEIEEREGIRSIAYSDWRQYLDELLKGTAEQYEATKAMIKSFAGVNPELAMQVIRLLNTEDRRKMALLHLVESMLELPVDRLEFMFLTRLVEQTEDPDLRDEIVFKVIRKLHECRPNPEVVHRFLPLLLLAIKMRAAEERCEACCLVLQLLLSADASGYSEYTSQLTQVMEDAWDAIDAGYRKIESGFKIVQLLAPVSIQTARDYLHKTCRLKDRCTVDHIAAHSFRICLALAIRSFAGLLPRRYEAPEDESRLGRLIDLIPAVGDQMLMWQEVALHFHAVGRFEDFRRIVEHRIRPLMTQISDSNHKHRDTMAVEVAPANYLAFPRETLAHLDHLPSTYRDIAYSRIYTYILWKQTVFHPYLTLPGQTYDITFDEALTLCDLIGRMDQDSLIYDCIRTLVNTVDPKTNKAVPFTKQQVAEIADHLERAIDGKLPNPRYIAHEGYRICARAQINRLRKSHTLWPQLVDSARAIPNVADRVYVLASVAACMRDANRSAELFREAVQLVDSIPFDLDRAERYELISRLSWRSDATLSKQCIQLAMKSVIGSDEGKAPAIRQRLMDFAHRIDPGLAESLTQLVDDDPARQRIRETLKAQYERNVLMTRLLDGQVTGDEGAIARRHLARATWKALGALNAGAVTPHRLEQTRYLARIAGSMPLTRSYPLLAWVIENARRRLSGTHQAATTLRSIFNATVLSAELAGRIATRNLPTQRSRRQAQTSDGSIVVSPTDRTEALR